MRYAKVKDGIIQQLAKSQASLTLTAAERSSGVTIIPVGDGAGVGEPAVQLRERESRRPEEPAPLLDPEE